MAPSASSWSPDPEINLAFGMMISEPCEVRMTVARMPICRTVPCWVPTSIRSPILIGRSKRTIRLETKVVDDILQAETDAHPEGAGQHGKLADVPHERGHREVEPKQQDGVMQKRWRWRRECRALGCTRR